LPFHFSLQQRLEAMLTEKLSTDKLIAINNVDKKPISLAVTSFTGIYRCFLMTGR
jgi:hypothetical protein